MLYYLAFTIILLQSVSVRAAVLRGCAQHILPPTYGPVPASSALLWECAQEGQTAADSHDDCRPLWSEWTHHSRGETLWQDMFTVAQFTSEVNYYNQITKVCASVLTQSYSSHLLCNWTKWSWILLWELFSIGCYEHVTVTQMQTTAHRLCCNGVHFSSL